MAGAYHANLEMLTCPKNSAVDACPPCAAALLLLLGRQLRGGQVRGTTALHRSMTEVTACLQKAVIDLMHETCPLISSFASQFKRLFSHHCSGGRGQRYSISNGCATIGPFSQIAATIRRSCRLMN